MIQFNYNRIKERLLNRLKSKENNIFVIVEEIINKDGEVWGLLKAFRKERNGWINLKYTQKK